MRRFPTSGWVGRYRKCANLLVRTEVSDQLGDAGRVVGGGVERQLHQPLQQGDVEAVAERVRRAQDGTQLTGITGQHHL